jgi:hypothetical protein
MPTQFRIYGLARPWTPLDYQAVLKLSPKFCTAFVVVNRGELQAAGTDLLYSLRRFLVCQARVREWPGTRLVGGLGATLRKFQLTEESTGILRSAAGTFWDWIEPRYPEDLSLLRPSGAPWFVSITHERDAFFKLFDEERATIEATLGSDSLIAQGDDQCPDEIY